MGKQVEVPGRPGTTVRPVLTPVWYLLGSVCIAVGIVVTVVFMQLGQRVPAPVETFRTDRSVEVTMDDDGLAILFGDKWGPGSSAKCGVLDADGEKVSVTHQPLNQEVDHDGEHWTVVYETSDVQPPGTYTVLCTATGAGLDIAVAPIDTTAQGLHSQVNVPWLSGVSAGLISTVVVFVVRRRGRARMRAAAREIA